MYFLAEKEGLCVALCFIFQMVQGGGLGSGLICFSVLPAQVLHGLSLLCLENSRDGVGTVEQAHAHQLIKKRF